MKMKKMGILTMLMAMVFLSGGLVLGEVEVAKADAINTCNNFYKGVTDCSGVNPTGCHSCTAIGSTVTSIENAHWWCHKHYSDCNYNIFGSCTSAAAGVRHSFCGRYEGCTYTGSGSCVGGTYTNADTLYQISCECSSPASCNTSGGVCSSENSVDVTDCVACNAAGYQYSSRCNDLAASCNVNDGNTAFCECGGIFPPCWSICDDTPGGCCSNAGKICFDTDGDGTKEDCILPVGLVLTAVAAPVSIPVTPPASSSMITFKVTLGGANVAATVNSITENGAGIVTANSCNTNAGTGECSVDYNATGAAETVTIRATHASDGINPDSGSASVVVTVNNCLDSAALSAAITGTWCAGNAVCMAIPQKCAPDDSRIYLSNSCNVGTNSCNVNNSTVCSTGCNVTCDDCAGTCNPGDCNGCDWCDGGWDPPILIDCFDSSGIKAPGAPGCCDTCGGGGGGGGGCTISWGAWTACAGAPGTETRSDSNSCTGDQSRLCCDNNTHCVLPKPICDVPADQCVECLTTPDCDAKGSGYVCDNKVCVPCSGEGEAAAGPHLCCEGLNWLNGICTSACDPNSWFFCNPLRTNVETLAESGERIIGYILGLIGSVALLLLIISGAMYMTSAGSEEKIASSKKILTAAVIGLAIALLAYSLLLVIMTVLGM